MDDKDKVWAFGGLHLAEKVRQIRKSLGDNQVDFGKRVGLSQQQISKIERGASVITRQIRHIARAGNMNIGDLLDDDDSFGPLTETEQIAVEKFRRLTADNKKEVIGMIEFKLSQQLPNDRDDEVEHENHMVHERFVEYANSPDGHDKPK